MLKFIHNIQLQVGKFYLKKEFSSVIRNKKVTNLDKAKTIGVLYSVGDEKQHTYICDFIKSLQDTRKEVKAIGFIDNTVVPHYCYPKLSYDYFTNKELNWYLKPNARFVNDFINKEFDILIDICTENCFPIQYIASMSIAKMKVGRFNANPINFYDIMIQVEENISLQELIKHITHYLKIINTVNNE